MTPTGPRWARWECEMLEHGLDLLASIREIELRRQTDREAQMLTAEATGRAAWVYLDDAEDALLEDLRAGSKAITHFRPPRPDRDAQ